MRYWLKFNIYKTKSRNPSATASRSLPSFCFGFIALTSNSDKSWSFPARAKLAKLSRSLNRSSRKFSLIFIYVMKIVTIYIVAYTLHMLFLMCACSIALIISMHYMHAWHDVRVSSVVFPKTYNKGTLAIFSQRAIVSRGDKIAESLS